MNPFKSKTKAKIDVLEDDPFARRKEPKWGWYTRHKMHQARESQEAIRVEEAFMDLKLREVELGTMETEERLCWDSYELPQRNRQRLISERFARIKKKKDKAMDEEFDLKKQKEQGFTSYNGAVKDFSRFRNSPALFHSFEGHSLGVLSVRLSSDYNYVVTCSDDTTVRLWDIHTHKCVRVFEGHNKAVFDCDVVSTFTKLDPMGGRIVSCSADKTLRIWDAVYGTSMKVIRGHTEVIFACSFTPDAQRIASASADRTVRLWDANEGHLIYIFHGHNSSVLSCAFSSTGKYLITSSDFGERSIKLWYTDMPHMVEKQEVGFRIQWEVTGLMRRITVKYDPLAGFFKDKVPAQLEMEEEDAADETWARDHPVELEEGEDDELAKAEKKAKEEERLALELPDKSECEGFSISVNSVDRFGRTSQVTSYYPGVELSVVLRGVDPFKQFFISAYYKRAQFEIFDEKSGARVGTFSEKCKEIPGAQFCCKQQAVGATRAGLDPSLTELNLSWTAPTMLDRASTVKGTVCEGGTIVFKATVSRDPLSLRSDEVDPGLVQLSFTLNEVDIPKKGTTLSEISQKIEKEEKVYQADVVSNHQLFIDFARNKDVNSACTLLSERVRMFLEGREIIGQEKVMEVFETLMMDLGTEVIIKDAKLLTNGVTVNSLDRDKSKDAKLKIVTPNKNNEKEEDNGSSSHNEAESGGGKGEEVNQDNEVDRKEDNDIVASNKKVKKKQKKKIQAVESINDNEEEEEEDDDEDKDEKEDKKQRRKSKKSKLKNIKANLPEGPSEWSNGPPILEVRKKDLMLDFAEHRHQQTLSSSKSSSSSSSGLISSLLSRFHVVEPIEDGKSDKLKKTSNKGNSSERRQEDYKLAIHEIRLKAEAEVKHILQMRRNQLLVAEEVRQIALLSTNQIRSLELHTEEDQELIGEGKFGIGESHYRMILPTIYPFSAISADHAQVSNKQARIASQRAKEQVQRQKHRILSGHLTADETEAMVEELMRKMIADEKAKKKFSINEKKRITQERIPGFEDSNDFNHHHQVRAYELNEQYKMNVQDLKQANQLLAKQFGHFSGSSMREIATSGSTQNDLTQNITTKSSSSRSSQSFDPLDSKTTPYNLQRRRHMFPTLPGAGTYDKNFSSVEDEEKALEIARNFEQGGLVRTFYIESFGKTHQRSHHNSVNQVVMSLDERRVASASSDTTIRLWDTKSGTLVSILKGHEHGVHTVAFSDEGTMLLSSGLDNYIILWNVATGMPLTRLYGHDDVVRRVMFFNDSTALVSCSGDHTAKVWYMTPQAPAPPDKPLVDSSTTTSMLVTWVPPPAFNEEVTAFHLEWRVGIREEFGHRLTCPGNDTSRDVIGLTPATPYQFRVRAINRMGDGRWSSPSAQYITKVDVPDALERPEVVVVTPFAMGIHFRAPTATIPGASISQFVIQLAGAGISFEDQVQRVVSWPLSRDAYLNFKELGVKNNTLSAAGHALVGNNDPIRIAKEKRAKSQIKMVERERAKIEAAAVADQRARWEKGDFSKTKFDIKREEIQKKKEEEAKLAARKKAEEEANAEDSDYDEESAAEDKRKLVVARRIAQDMQAAQEAQDKGILKNYVDHFYLFEGLKPGLMYRLRVAGVSTIGMGRWSCSTISMMSAPTEPDAPRAPTIIKDSISKFGLTVKWVSPHENGSAVIGFTVKYCHDGSEISLGPHATHLDITELDPGKKYSFQIRAANQQGHGPWSPKSLPVRTLTDLAEPPNPPEWSVSGIEWIDLVVDMPYANGEPIVSFVVQYREISMQTKSTFGGDQTLPLDLIADEPIEEPNTALSILSNRSSVSDGGVMVNTIKGKKKQVKVRKGVGKCALHVMNLKADHTYDFRCAAINSKGVSQFGKPSKRARTLKPLAPESVQHLDPTEVYPNALVLSWEPPICHGAEIESYVIEQVRVAFRPEALNQNNNDNVQNEDDEDDDDPEALAKSRAEARDKDMFVTHACEGWDESKRIDELTIGSTYKFRICAMNSVGAGPFSGWTPDITVDEECVGDPFSWP